MGLTVLGVAPGCLLVAVSWVRIRVALLGAVSGPVGWCVGVQRLLAGAAFSRWGLVCGLVVALGGPWGGLLREVCGLWRAVASVGCGPLVGRSLELGPWGWVMGSWRRWGWAVVDGSACGVWRMGSWAPVVRLYVAGGLGLGFWVSCRSWRQWVGAAVDGGACWAWSPGSCGAVPVVAPCWAWVGVLVVVMGAVGGRRGWQCRAWPQVAAGWCQAGVRVWAIGLGVMGGLDAGRGAAARLGGVFGVGYGVVRGGVVWVCVLGGVACRWAMKQRILGYRTPPCHRRPVIATQSSISSSYCALITTRMFLCVPAHRSALLTKHQYYSTSKSSTSSDPQHEDLNFDIIAP